MSDTMTVTPREVWQQYVDTISVLDEVIRNLGVEDQEWANALWAACNDYKVEYNRRRKAARLAKKGIVERNTLVQPGKYRQPGSSTTSLGNFTPKGKEVYYFLKEEMGVAPTDRNSGPGHTTIKWVKDVTDQYDLDLKRYDTLCILKDQLLDQGYEVAVEWVRRLESKYVLDKINEVHNVVWYQQSILKIIIKG